MPTALLYDVHGNLPALQAVLADAQDEGADRWVLGGDLVAFGAWPRECLQTLRALRGATWIRGNTERWLTDRSDAPEPMDAAALACRAALGDADADALVRLPETAMEGETLYCHASPGSDMASFLPAEQEGDAALLGDVEADRVVFGHTHLQFRRGGPRGVELVNPGSIGMPLDGDHRAAYALVHDDGELDLRRVAYDHEAAIAALDGPEPWREVVQGRLRRAAP